MKKITRIRDKASKIMRVITLVTQKFNFRHVSNENFLNGTPDFQRGILKVMTDYFKDAIIKDDYDDGKVEGLIEKTNKAILKTGYKFTFKRTSMQSEAIDIKVIKTEKK